MLAAKSTNRKLKERTTTKDNDDLEHDSMANGYRGLMNLDRLTDEFMRMTI